jgi:hypothetical protein
MDLLGEKTEQDRVLSTVNEDDIVGVTKEINPIEGFFHEWLLSNLLLAVGSI